MNRGWEFSSIFCFTYEIVGNWASFEERDVTTRRDRPSNMSETNLESPSITTLKSRGFAAWIECDGNKIECYDVQNLSSNLVMCWIPSEAGKVDCALLYAFFGLITSDWEGFLDLLETRT